MRFDEQLHVPVSIDAAWEFLWDTTRLAGCLPGCTNVLEFEPGKRYKAQFEDRIGPYKVHFEMDVVVQEAEPPQRIQVFASGQDRRLGTSQRVTLEVALRQAGPSETVLDVRADVEVLGKVATLGQFVIKRKVKDVVKKFAENIRAELQAQPRGSI